MRYWVLKLSRDGTEHHSLWLRKGALSRDGTNHPLVKQRPEPGDRCFYWQPSPEKRLVGLGTILRVRKNAKGRLVVTSRADTGELRYGLDIATLRRVPVLKGEVFLNPGYPATFYAINDVVAGMLYSVVGAAAPLYNNVWESAPQAPAGAAAARRAVARAAGAPPHLVARPSRAADKKQLQARTVRAGQPKFRALLMTATGGRCEITGSTVTAALDACHIQPYKAGGTYAVSNGVMLRTDIHSLVDAGLIGIAPGTLTLRCAKALEGTEYWKYDGKALLKRLDGSEPSKALLKKYWRP